MQDLKIKSQGFSLIELLFTVAIISIVASIAIPNYKDFMQRSTLRSIQSDLSAISLSLENEYQAKLSYPVHNLANSEAISDEFSRWKSASEEFNFSLKSTTEGYEISAVAQSGALKDCTLTLNDKGDQTLTKCEKHSSDGKWI